jgi:ankyrin repeat protein
MSGGTWQSQTQAELIELLIQRGAKLEHVDRGVASALHGAVRARSPAAVRQLLSAGARVDVCDLTRAAQLRCIFRFSPPVREELPEQ